MDACMLVRSNARATEYLTRSIVCLRSCHLQTKLWSSTAAYDDDQVDHEDEEVVVPDDYTDGEEYESQHT